MSDKTEYANPEADKNWPAWFYGANGAEKLCESPADVPAGFHDHPSKVSGEKPAPTQRSTGNETAKNPVTPPVVADAGGKPITADNKGDVTELDADGHPFDPALHAATRSKTTAGLWRMKVGVSRPAPAPGYPKPALDL